jgi:YD repeat-containing protein
VIAAVLLLPTVSYAATTYSHDGLGRLSTVSYENGKQIVYNYDAAGNRSSVVTQATPPLMPHAKAASARRKTKPKQ